MSIYSLISLYFEILSYTYRCDGYFSSQRTTKKWLVTYENLRIYKKRAKAAHDKMILEEGRFIIREKVFLYCSRFYLQFMIEKL